MYSSNALVRETRGHLGHETQGSTWPKLILVHPIRLVAFLGFTVMHLNGPSFITCICSPTSVNSRLLPELKQIASIITSHATTKAMILSRSRTARMHLEGFNRFQMKRGIFEHITLGEHYPICVCLLPQYIFQRSTFPLTSFTFIYYLFPQNIRVNMVYMLPVWLACAYFFVRKIQEWADLLECHRTIFKLHVPCTGHTSVSVG